MTYDPFEFSDGLRYEQIIAKRNYDFYCIGDIHGCGSEFDRLVASIYRESDERGSTAVLICNGDMIDRGPEFSYVLEKAIKHIDIAILGNHEHNFVLERLGKPCTSNSRKTSHDRFEKMSVDAQKDAMEFLNGMRNFVVIEFPERTFVLSHAPLKDMEQYSGWGKYLHIGNAPFFCMRSSVPIDEDIANLNQHVTFVYGHQSWEYKDVEEQKLDQVGRMAQYYNIDGGAVYGGQLIALRLNDLKVLKVDSSVKVSK